MIRDMKKRILVTGGSGFIGSHLCEALLDYGHEVICLDNLSTGDKNNIKLLMPNNNFYFILSDTRELSLDKLPFDGRIDEIYDLASPASVTYVSDHPIEAATVNAIGTKNLLELSLKFHAKFLFASSSEVYGNPKEHPQKETYWGNVNSIGIRSGYDEGKRFGEALTMAYSRELGLSTKIIRIFNTYGPHTRIDDSRVIPSFVTKALKGEPLAVHGDGSQTRSFCYISDMITGMITLMDSNINIPMNIGNPIEYTINDLATKIISATESSSKIIFVERPPDDPAVRCPDITLAKKLIHWSPMVSLSEGLTKTIEYFRKLD